jgi:hypothetical protein
MLKKFEIKYCFKSLEERNNFLHKNFSIFEMEFELKFGDVNVCF